MRANQRQDIYGIGQESEQMVATYFSKKYGCLVVPVSEYTNNTGVKINAPMLIDKDGPLISPDLLIINNNKSFWIEVKQKSEPTYYWKKSRWEHGIDKPNFDAYLETQKSSYPVYIIIHEINSPNTPDLYLSSKDDISAFKKMKSDLQRKDVWLRISINDASLHGQCRPSNPEMISTKNPLGLGIYWPRSNMQEIQDFFDYVQQDWRTA